MMQIRTSLTYNTAPACYKQQGFSFVGSAYDMWKHNGNCTHYAYARTCELSGKNVARDLMDYFPNAGLWFDNAKWKKGATPKAGAIACYGGIGTAGHVEIVEHVNEDGSYYVSTSGWNSYIFRNTTRHCKVGQKLDNVAGYLLGFIYNPYITEDEPDTKPEPIENANNELKVGDRVKIVAVGNSQANGRGSKSYGLGWERQIMSVYKGEYPYKVGDGKKATGWYKRECLEKI